MSNTGEKVTCKVRPMKDGKMAPGYDALAHIVRSQYDERFTVVYGSLSIACETDELLSLVQDAQAIVQFEDNRRMTVKLMGAELSCLQVVQGQIISSEWNQIYFVATTGLDNLSSVK